MRIETLIQALGARCLSRPAVSSIRRIRANAEEIRMGDCLIALDDTQIRPAVQNGAYAIISDQPLQPSDPEIAWLQVPSLRDALPRLLALWFEQVQPTRLGASLAAAQMLTAMTPKNRPAVIRSADPPDLLKAFREEGERAVILCGPNLQPLLGSDTLYPDAEPLKVRCISANLFTAHLLIGEHAYENLCVPLELTDVLEEALRIGTHLQLPLKPERLAFTSSMQPLYVTRQLEPRPFGMSERVITVGNNPQVYDKIADNALRASRWAEALLLLPTKLKLDYDKTLEIRRFDNIENLKTILETTHSRFTYIFGMTQEKLLPILRQAPAHYSTPKDLRDYGLF